MNTFPNLEEISLHDSGLHELHFDAVARSLVIVFDRAPAYAWNEPDQCGNFDVTLAALDVADFTIFRLREPDFVVGGVFRRGSETVSLLDLLRTPGSVDDADIRISPFAGISFRAARVSVSATPNTEEYPFPEPPLPVLPSSQCPDDIAIAKGWPEFCELQSVTFRAREDFDQVSVVFREAARANAVRPQRYVELHGIGLQLFHAYRLNAPFEMTAATVRNEAGEPVALSSVTRAGFERSTINLSFRWQSRVEWKTRQLSVRVASDPSELSIPKRNS